MNQLAISLQGAHGPNLGFMDKSLQGTLEERRGVMDGITAKGVERFYKRNEALAAERLAKGTETHGLGAGMSATNTTRRGWFWDWVGLKV